MMGPCSAHPRGHASSSVSPECHLADQSCSCCSPLDCQAPSSQGCRRVSPLQGHRRSGSMDRVEEPLSDGLAAAAQVTKIAASTQCFCPCTFLEP